MPAQPALLQLRAYPAIRILVLAFLGAAISYGLSLSYKTCLITGIICVLLCSLIESYKPKNYRLSKNLRTTGYLILLMCMGALCMSYYQQEKSNQMRLKQYYESLIWSDISIEAIITSFTHAGEKWQIEVLNAANQEEIQMHGLEAYLFIEKQELLSTGFQPKKGDRIQAVVQVLPAPDYLAEATFKAQFKTRMLYQCKKSSRVSALESMHRVLQSRLNQSFAESEKLQSLSKAILLGMRSAVSNEMKERFQRAGLSHILAVSGMHVGMLLLPFWWVMPLFWRKNETKWLFLSMCASLLLLYCIITGSSASVVRASSMALILLIAKLWRLNSRPMNTLSVVALGMLIINPAAITDLGFQLSFLAVACIFLVFQPIESLIPINIRWKGSYRYLGGPLLFTTTLQIAMFPLTALYFGMHSLIAPLANLIFLPFLSLVLFPLFIFGVMLGKHIPAFIVQTADFVFGYFLDVLDYLLLWPHAYWEVNTPSIQIVLLLLGVIFGLNLLPFPKWRWKWVIIMLLMGCIFRLSELYSFSNG